MPDMFCSADAPWLDGITPRSKSVHTTVFGQFSFRILPQVFRHSECTLADLTDSRAGIQSPLTVARA